MRAKTLKVQIFHKMVMQIRKSNCDLRQCFVNHKTCQVIDTKILTSLIELDQKPVRKN